MPARKPSPTPEDLTVTFFESNQVEKLKRLTKSENHKALNFVKLWDITKGVQCTECKEVKPLYSYQAGKSSACGFKFTKCTKCYNAARCPFKLLVSSAQSHTKERNAKGRDHGEVEFDAEYAKEMYKSQDGKCAYLPEYCQMVAAQGDGNPLNMSLERKANHNGYQKTNAVLICQFLQFGHGGNFDKESTRALIFYNQETDDDYVFNKVKFMEEYNRDGNATQRKARKSIKIKDNTGAITHKICTDCQVQKPIKEFSDKLSYCKPCGNSRDSARRNTIRGFIKKMIHDASQSAEKRGKKRNRNDESGEVDSNVIQLVLEEIIEQGNRCKLTGIPFVYQLKHPHAPSIDRFYNSKGYIKGNFRIIVAPLNTPVQLPDDQFEAMRQKHFQRLNLLRKTWLILKFA